MEPDLILHPILERAVPALEALIETQRTIAVIKALGAIAPALVCRHVCYGGAKHLLPILDLLLPGIDLNDPPKTFCTTAFIVEVAQYIKFGEMTSDDQSVPINVDMGRADSDTPDLDITVLPASVDLGEGVRRTPQEEDAILANLSATFADWVAAFLRRVILLFENLPEEGADGTVGGSTEVQLVDSVSGAFSQICVHLSEPLYDMVLNMVFDYASNNVRSNAVRAIHQLVECVANADPVKTLAKFVPYCDRNIRIELEHGSSSLRTTSSSSTPLPSDATLHWNLAILRGSMYNDGKAVRGLIRQNYITSLKEIHQALPYREQLISLFKVLHQKTFSKRGFSSSGKLISSTLLTLTHTYPLENKFVNPDEWASEDFKKNHHKYWGKLYKPEDVKLTWHIPSNEEIDFTLQIFREVIEPILSTLDTLLKPGVVRDAVWRNDFCRHLSFVRNAFSGIPTLAKEYIPPEDWSSAIATSDILHEIPEMIAAIEPLNAGFALTDPNDPRHQYITRLRHRFGQFLHRASESLRQQGEENTVDAVQMLIRSMRTYMLEYGDSRDKFYHSARLRWNSIERRRTALEDKLIDDLTEWAMWHYVIVREISQSLLESLCNCFDGVRRRCLPKLYKALDPGTDDDRMKGALWTLNSGLFAKYAICEPTLTTEFVNKLFGCQHNERPSIQEYVSSLSDTCLNHFVEPSYSVYEVTDGRVERAIRDLKSVIGAVSNADLIVDRCRNQRISRLRLTNESIEKLTDSLLAIANSPNTHWRYAIVATRCLRTLVRRDAPMTSSHVRYLLEKTYDSHSDIRYVSLLDSIHTWSNANSWYVIKGPVDLVLEQNHNPLRRTVPVQSPSHAFRSEWLAQFKIPVDLEKARQEPLLFDKISSGWLVWRQHVDCFLAPDAVESTFQPWDGGCEEAVETLRTIVTDPSYWEKLSTHYSAENNTDAVTQDNASCVKSIFQLLEDEPFEALKPTLETLIADKDKNKQRAAADFLAGIFSGSKHWPTDSQLKLWEWFERHSHTVFGQKSNDTLPIWTSFLEYVFFNRDPRRLQPMVDHVVAAFKGVNFNSESAFDVIQVLAFYRALYEELGWKFLPWIDDALEKCWRELGRTEHDDVLAYISELFTFSGKVMWSPRPSVPVTETFVRECRTLPLDHDIMGIRGTYHRERVLDLVEKFDAWRMERLPGARAFQSTYDRVGILVCKWLFQIVHDINAAAAFDYVLPLMASHQFRALTELKADFFRLVNDNDDLAHRAQLLLVRMCGVVPPRQLINPMLDAIFTAIQTSPSWRVRLKILPLVQVFYFRQFPLISNIKIGEMLEVVCRCLDDEVVEVREMAATTLSGILRLSPRRSVLHLRDRFVRLLKNSTLPDRKSAAYTSALRQRHAAILGICALVDSYPYTVERWMPDLITGVLAEHTYDPVSPAALFIVDETLIKTVTSASNLSNNLWKPAMSTSQDAASSSNDSVMQTFGKFRDELDDYHDRRERLIKSSRDVTSLSKKVIFLLHRTLMEDSSESDDQALCLRAVERAKDKLREIQGLLVAMHEELAGDRFWRYQRNVSPGLQEYIEALSFAHYLESRSLISYSDVQKSLLGEDGVLYFPLPLEDYLLGLADLTGELMRYAISSISRRGGRFKAREVCEFVRGCKADFEGLTPYFRELRKKQQVTAQSLEKIENVAYAIAMRSFEYDLPPELLDDIVDQTVSQMAQLNDRGNDRRLRLAPHTPVWTVDPRQRPFSAKPTATTVITASPRGSLLIPQANSFHPLTTVPLSPMRLTFTPALGEVMPLVISEVHCLDVQSVSPQVLVFQAMFDSRVSYEQAKRDGVKVELWADLPVEGRPSWEWGAFPFQAYEQSPLHANLSNEVVSLTLSEEQGLEESSAYAVYAKVPVKLHEYASGHRFAFTYRLVYPSGEIKWLGKFGWNGALVVDKRSAPCAVGVDLHDGWTFESRDIAAFRSAGSGEHHVGTLGHDLGWSTWAIYDDSWPVFSRTGESQFVSSMVLVPSSRSHKVIPSIPLVISATLDSRVRIGNDGQIIHKLASAGGQLFLSPIQAIPTAPTECNRMGPVQVNEHTEFAVMASSSANGLLPISLLVIPLTPITRTQEVHIHRDAVEQLLPPSSRQLFIISSPLSSTSRLSTDGELVTFRTGRHGGYARLSPVYSLESTSGDFKGNWGISLLDMHTNAAIHEQQGVPQRVLPTPPPSPPPVLRVAQRTQVPPLASFTEVSEQLTSHTFSSPTSPTSTPVLDSASVSPSLSLASLDIAAPTPCVPQPPCKYEDNSNTLALIRTQRPALHPFLRALLAMFTCLWSIILQKGLQLLGIHASRAIDNSQLEPSESTGVEPNEIVEEDNDANLTIMASESDLTVADGDTKEPDSTYYSSASMETVVEESIPSSAYLEQKAPVDHPDPKPTISLSVDVRSHDGKLSLLVQPPPKISMGLAALKFSLNGEPIAESDISAFERDGLHLLKIHVPSSFDAGNLTVTIT
ncbi:uncharacterized protein FIBRA_03703 [Fibroporia radiculosa]|uniref:Uncharacterized protein n=1 Tax=Fibroporia radiculosa TaxID=599839 RepID=J4HW49_9APHY|nr:uncharacterized protein FIBRA_03703 [Fibroporia radiculosa]CCM01642.1 predicted protein [Fibroporia radiculosa]